MASIDWPSSLPERWQKDVSEELADNTIFTDMELGAAKARRRTTSNVGRLTGSIAVTNSQWDDLVTFYKDTVKGVLPFNMPRPRGDGTTVEVRFRAVPSRSYLSPGRWKVSLVLEVLA